MSRKPSDLTVTDLFCGAGGSSIGASEAGGRLRMALNHWDLAIETHNTNFPDADHDCTDASACDPRRYPSTQILLASPECTSHSLAKGKRRKSVGQGDLFVPTSQAPEARWSWEVGRELLHLWAEGRTGVLRGIPLVGGDAGAPPVLHPDVRGRAGPEVTRGAGRAAPTRLGHPGGRGAPMTQLDLFAPCTSPHVQVSTPTRTPPPSRWPSNDPELWATLPQGRPAVLELLRRRHAGDLDAMAGDLERLIGPNPHVTQAGEWDKGARYGAAHVLAWRLRNGKEAAA